MKNRASLLKYFFFTMAVAPFIMGATVLASRHLVCANLRCMDPDAFPLTIDPRSCFALGNQREHRELSLAERIHAEWLGMRYAALGTEFVEFKIAGRRYTISEEHLEVPTWLDGCGGVIRKSGSGTFIWRTQ